jgi:hypothetical protein
MLEDDPGTSRRSNSTRASIIRVAWSARLGRLAPSPDTFASAPAATAGAGSPVQGSATAVRHGILDSFTRWSLADRIGVAAVCLLVMVASLPLVAGGTLIGQDSATFFYPMYGFLGDWLRAGEIPAWNPHQFSGAPFAGDPESGWTYLPAMLLFGVLPLDVAASTFIVFHLALAALAAYGLARLLGIGPAGAVTAAAIAGLNGLTYGRSSCCPAYLQVSAWVPPLLLAAEMVARSRTPAARMRAWGITGFVLSQILASWIGQGAGYALLVLAGYLAFRSLLDPPGTAGPLLVRLRRLALDGAAVMSIGFALAAAGLLPRFAFHAESILSDGYTGELAWAAELGGWTAVEAAGRLFGRGLNYLGGSVIVLALIGLLLARRRFAMPFWSALSFGVLLLSAEQSSPVHALLRLVAPPFAQLHAHWPERAMVVFYIGPALLAGAGVTALGHLAEARSEWPVARLRSWRGTGWSLRLTALGVCLALATAFPFLEAIAVTLTVVGGLAGVLGLALAGSRGRHWATAALVLIIAIDLLAAGRYAMAHDQWYGGFRKVDLNTYYDPSGAAAFLQQRQVEEQPFRFFGYDPTIAYKDPTHGEVALYRYQYADPRTTELLVNNRATVFGLDDVQGYNPLQNRRYVELLAAANGQVQEYHGAYVLPGALDSPLLDLLNARYAVVPAHPPSDWPGTMLEDADLPVVYADDEVRVLQRPTALPRAWIVHEAREVEPGGALAPIARGEIDVRRVALLEDEPPMLAPPMNPAADTVRVLSYEPDSIVVQTQTDAPGLLVLSEVWDAGWEATVDGVEATVRIANHALRAVAIPAGLHTVTLRYTPTTLQVGMVISGVGIVALTAMLLAGSWLPPSGTSGQRRQQSTRAA